MLKSYALILLGRLATAHTDTETPEARELRQEEDSAVIAYAAKTRLDVQVLITIGKFESEFAQYVSEGCLVIPKKADGDCDRGLARSYWQVRRWCKKGWALPRGSVEAKKEFAVCALRHWKYGYRECKGSYVGAFSAYRSKGCGWRGPKDRGARARAYYLRRLGG